MSYRVGAVSYLNTKPLIYGLGARLPQAELILDLPSRLADRLSEGDLDVALIPSVEFFRSEGVSIVSDACIACRGPVRSVRILFRKPPGDVRSLALDEGSRTSAALAQVLLARRFNVRPRLLPFPIEAEMNSADADATVVIGDRAMDVNQDEFCEVWDLGEEWTRDTGLSFVFAMWVAFENRTPPKLAEALAACRDEGLGSIDQIVAEHAEGYRLSHPDCKKYYTEQLYFHLGEQELRGLELFRTEATKLGLLPTTAHQLSLQAT